MAVLAAAVIVFVPGTGDDDEGEVVHGGAQNGVAPGGSASAATGGTTGVGGAGSDEPSGVTGAPSTGAGGGGTAIASATVEGGSGVGTPEALGHRWCDAGTERFEFPSLWSPLCVRPWSKGADNGGATAPGVTKDKITIVIRAPVSNTDTAADDDKARRQIADTFDIYEKHHELWGRTFDVKYFRQTANGETAERADALKIADMKPFLVIGLINATGGAPRVLSTELAARKIMVMDPDVSFTDAQAQPGYRWGYNIDDRLLILQIAEYAGKRLQGGLARWAGDPTMAARKRVIGMVHPDVWDMKTFQAEASKYGLSLAASVEYPQGGAPTLLAERARTIIAKLHDEGVTTVIAGTDPIFTAILTKEATLQRFRPEWVSTGWNLQDTTVLSRTYDSEQWRHAFGIGLIPPLPDLEKEERTVMHQWHHGRVPPDTDTKALHGMVYLALRDVVPAMQLAGPQLTPQTFREAMFAKPPAGGVHCGCLISTGTSYGRKWQGLPWDDYSGFDDTVESWWDPTDVGADELGVTAPGVWKRVAGGKRYRFGTWPRGEPDVFNQANATFHYDEVPPPDRWRDYPHENH